MNKAACICICISLVFAASVKAQDAGTFTDTRDGHTYRTITIGSQTWMAENLAYLPRVDLVNDLSWDKYRYWVYGYSGEDVEKAVQEEHYRKFGALYNWPAAMEDACPDGWRLPDEKDWQELEEFLGMGKDKLWQRGWRESGEAGRKLKTASGWYADSGTDEYGFNALPGGLLGYNSFETRDYSAYFWVGAASSRDNAWIRSLMFSKDGIQRMEERKWFGCSVRCIKGQK